MQLALLNQLSQVQFGKNFGYTLPLTCLLELLTAENLRETNISVSRSHLLFLFFRYLKKVFEEEINKNKEGNSLVINLVILNFELPSTFLYVLCELFIKYAVLCGNNIVLVKIRDSLFRVTNRCKVTSKLSLSSVSEFKFCAP